MLLQSYNLILQFFATRNVTEAQFVQNFGHLLWSLFGYHVLKKVDWKREDDCRVLLS